MGNTAIRGVSPPSGQEIPKISRAMRSPMVRMSLDSVPVPPKPGTPAAPPEHLDDGAWKGEAGGGDAAATSMTPRDAGAGGGGAQPPESPPD